MADDPTFEPGTAGQVARLVAAVRALRDEAAGLSASASMIASEIAVLRGEIGMLAGAMERQSQMIVAVMGEQAKHGVVQGQIMNGLADIFYAVVAPPPEPAEPSEQEPDPGFSTAVENGSHPADAPADSPEHSEEEKAS